LKNVNPTVDFVMQSNFGEGCHLGRLENLLFWDATNELKGIYGFSIYDVFIKLNKFYT
jgi:hypothetical protein